GLAHPAPEDVHRDRVPLGDRDRPQVGELPGRHEAQVLAVAGQEEDGHLVGLRPERAGHELDHALRHVEEQLARVVRPRLAVRHGAQDLQEVFHRGNLIRAGCAGGRIIPRWRAMSLYRDLRATDGPAVLFESTTPAGPRSRRSILARWPRALAVGDRGRVRIASASGIREEAIDPIAAVRALLATVPEGRWPDEGGVAGVLAYDY